MNLRWYRLMIAFFMIALSLAMPPQAICGDFSCFLPLGHASDHAAIWLVRPEVVPFLPAGQFNFIGENRRDVKVLSNDYFGADSAAKDTSVVLPVIGELDSSLSLPVMTVLIAGLDAFNPCAFFVLLFLLSMLVHARSRAKMMVIGGIYVFFSGLIYFVFMAAWLNVFFVIGELERITLMAGIFAVIIAMINIKDFFRFKRGISLSIPQAAKPGLYDRVRRLIKLSHWPSVILGTVLLAIAANSYEVMCTAGFPMVYTRILTLNRLSPLSYYLYLALYNFIYIVPLVIIVALFTIKLGTRKLSENEGRVLKLLSGIMMFFLGNVLIFAPQLLNHFGAALGVIAGALMSTFLIVRLDQWRRRRKAE